MVEVKMVDGEIKFFYKGEEISPEAARQIVGATIQYQETDAILNHLAKEEFKND